MSNGLMILNIIVMALAAIVITNLHIFGAIQLTQQGVNVARLWRNCDNSQGSKKLIFATI